MLVSCDFLRKSFFCSFQSQGKSFALPLLTPRKLRLKDLACFLRFFSFLPLFTVWVFLEILEKITRAHSFYGSDPNSYQEASFFSFELFGNRRKENMSRCFPYSPPGYARNGVSGQALIKSIKPEIVYGELKLQRRKETEQAKEWRRERRERKKERKEKEKLKFSEISSNINMIVDNVIGRSLPKQREEDAEQVKSDISEEHKQPISSQNSNKRRRHASPSTESQNDGQVIHIRLSFKKHKGTDASSGEGVCSISDGMVYPPWPQQPQYQDSNTRTDVAAFASPVVSFGHVSASNANNKKAAASEPCFRMNGVSPVVSSGHVSGSSTINKEAAASDPCFRMKGASPVVSYGYVSGSSTINKKAASSEPGSRMNGAFPVVSSGHVSGSSSSNKEAAASEPCFRMKGASPVVTSGHVSGSSTINKKAAASEPCSRMKGASHVVSSGPVSGSGPINKKAAASEPCSRTKGASAGGVEILYKSLIEGWRAPPLSLNEHDCGKLEWLLGTEQQRGKGSRVKRNEMCHVSSTLWPRASFLANADMHALPYTIPF